MGRFIRLANFLFFEGHSGKIIFQSVSLLVIGFINLDGIRTVCLASLLKIVEISFIGGEGLLRFLIGWGGRIRVRGFGMWVFIVWRVKRQVGNGMCKFSRFMRVDAFGPQEISLQGLDCIVTAFCCPHLAPRHFDNLEGLWDGFSLYYH